ncbi:aldo/keto reductase [Melissococcus plutonius]|uniref:Oxidoreductase of aldo/ keto reductase family, subgroup 1 n=1 Tax=Melissococcus plutonius (strain ATCC 35311 / DSM 29964 / CIP 104052 / LMG 20360 / NCIMB 702443) TaxID=940190 RepID=F3YAD9_MELPT|nr:aldo/keto reductase [Melissococcus plutonius]AIM24947.1 glyoxal reductase YvgN [Melissococcus plutonius S1]KMT25093.1 glyoxal reductase YvgN [Melissococcus plutonius]KMT26730.1 glyoxal reductase YvgN [Melissococcus plutonius]KMT27980.1 glyoxal reductase YvgN [Melissococcus plutonius]KMT29753.1 glyoxal reductase YvgN [Melissococcus plutonius]
MAIEKFKQLANGVSMPRLGLGVWRVNDGKEATMAVKWALTDGYRLIDTAAIYGNEQGVGQGIKQSGMQREEIFVTTKLWNEDQGYESTFKAFEQSLEKLGLDYIDLYLIHWPVTGKYKDSWRAMEEIYRSGKAKAIGVSNFQQKHLENLMTEATITPMVDQIELHPTLTQKALTNYLADNKIAVEAWSPLGQGSALKNDHIIKIGEKYHKSAAQVIIRWHLQNDHIVIPKSVHEERIKENFDVFNFGLTEEEMQQISQLNTNTRLGTNPDTYDIY